MQFARGAGEQHKPGVAASGAVGIWRKLEGESRSGPVAIDEDPCAFGNVGLHLGPGGDGASARGEVIADPLLDFRGMDQAASEEGGDPFPGEVVTRGAKASRGEDKVRPAQRFANGGLDVLRPIRNRHLAGNGPPEIGEAPSEPLLMGVQDPTQQQFASGIDQFDVHAEQGTAKRPGRQRAFTTGVGRDRGREGSAFPVRSPAVPQFGTRGLPAQDQHPPEGHP